MEVFLGDVVTMVINTAVDLTGNTVRLLYKKPNNDEGFWLASIDSADHTLVNYTTNSTDLDTLGKWKLQIVAYQGNTIRHGQVFECKVHKCVTTSPIGDTIP